MAAEHAEPGAASVLDRHPADHARGTGAQAGGVGQGERIVAAAGCKVDEHHAAGRLGQGARRQRHVAAGIGDVQAARAHGDRANRLARALLPALTPKVPPLSDTRLPLGRILLVGACGREIQQELAAGDGGEAGVGIRSREGLLAGADLRQRQIAGLDRAVRPARGIVAVNDAREGTGEVAGPTVRMYVELPM